MVVLTLGQNLQHRFTETIKVFKFDIGVGGRINNVVAPEFRSSARTGRFNHLGIIAKRHRRVFARYEGAGHALSILVDAGNIEDVGC